MPRFNLEDYVTVQERIVQFWQDHPEGRIITMIQSAEENFKECRYEARIYTSLDGPCIATGWAFEIAGGTGPNSTSHEENAETSAIGRALANLGYATSQKNRPSREEMSKVNRGSPDYESGEIEQQIAHNNVLGYSGGGPAEREARAASAPPSNGHSSSSERMASEPQKNMIFSVAKKVWEFDAEDTKKWVYSECKIDTMHDLTMAQAKQIIDTLLAEQKKINANVR